MTSHTDENYIFKGNRGESVSIINYYTDEDKFSHFDFKYCTNWVEGKINIECSTERFRDLVRNIVLLSRNEIDGLEFINENGNLAIGIQKDDNGVENISLTISPNMIDEDSLTLSFEGSVISDHLSYF